MFGYCEVIFRKVRFSERLFLWRKSLRRSELRGVRCGYGRIFLFSYNSVLYRKLQDLRRCDDATGGAGLICGAEKRT